MGAQLNQNICNMKSTILILLVLLVSFASSKSLDSRNSDSDLAAGSNHVKLSLYYESLCPYCKKFISEQLGPTFGQFEKYLEVILNPSGNAHMKQDSETGQYQFNCQHGPKECQGSIIEGCLINKMSDMSPVATIACIESSDPSNPKTTQKCMQSTDVTSPTFDEIQQCANGEEGNKIFAQLGKETSQLKPRHKYVPWIIFNDGTWDEDLQNEATINLPATLCRHFLRGVPECSP